MEEKIEVARRQLGTALELFLQDLDPISVHCLACGAAEIIDFYAEQNRSPRFTDHALKANQGLDLGSLLRMQRRYWNAFKHAAKAHKGAERVEDVELLRRFNDEQNDHALYVGWSDYMLLVGKAPVEVQAFQVWYFARYPEKLAPDVDVREHAAALFPSIRTIGRPEQKAMLRNQIAEARDSDDIMMDPRTERRPLVLPWP